MKPVCLCLLLIVCATKLQAEEFSFDIASYSKSPYELGGYAEFSAINTQLNTSSALSNLLPATINSDSNNQYTTGLQLEGLYRFSNSQFFMQFYAENQNSDVLASQHDTLFNEIYYTDSHLYKLNIEIGKRVQKWGKGYAWSPVGFIERKKDPNDPELSREGYYMLSADYVRSFQGNLKTLAIMPVYLPVTESINNDFSTGVDNNGENNNFAGRVYFLYRDIDFDVVFLSKGSKSARLGVDFSSNVSTNFEVHGEYAYIFDETLSYLSPANQLIERQKDVKLSLLGVRYLTSSEITWIAEYYHNGSGYTQAQLETFFNLLESDFTVTPQLLTLAQQASQSGYGKVNPGKDYLYLSGIQKEPFNWVYLNIGFNSIVNLHDKSYSITPEVSYSGYKNTEIRLRASFLQGDQLTEFGEKLNQKKLEFRLRYYF